MEQKTLQMILELIESSQNDDLISIISELSGYNQFSGLIKAISERMTIS